MTDLAELRLFVHLAATGHFGRTSAACHVSQPALSRAIARLEREVGAPLLVRDRRGAVLSEAGVRFRETAEEMLASWERFGAADEAPAAVRGSVTLYCSVTASQTLVPALLRRAHDAHPEVRIDLQTGYAADALAKLDDGSAQLTVAPLPPRVPRHLLVSVLASTTLVPVVASGRRADWAATDLVLPSSGLARTLVDRWLARAGIRPRSITEAVGHEAVLALVAAGYGVGIVPDLVADRSPLAAQFARTKPPASLPGFDVGVCTTPDHLAARPVRALWSAIADGSTP